MNREKKILIVEDEQEIRNLLVLYLNNYGYQTIVAENGLEALERFEGEQPDLILLDILLPKMNGIDVLREIRQYSNVPIIFMSCRKDGQDIIEGLELGGDDYITKPFDPNIVVARVQANLRRAPIYRRHQLIMNNQEQVPQVLKYNQVEINLDNLEVKVAGVPITLAAKELQLLLFLIKNPDKIFTTEELFAKVWGGESYGDTRTVMVHISNIRKKLEHDSANQPLIQNIRGIGYKFVGKPS